ncbi:universal stress protein [bacterium]|nr:MAG: universal stress protein [bacterium]
MIEPMAEKEIRRNKMSSKVKTILCAIALSPNTDQIVMSAVREAAVHDAHVHLLHIIPSFDASMAVPIVSFMGEEKYHQLMEDHKKETTGAIRGEIDKIKEGLKGGEAGENMDRIKRIHVYEGDPELEILNMVKTLKADMLVIGTHSKEMTEHTFIGSVARKVLRRVTVPILLVPPVSGQQRD